MTKSFYSKKVGKVVHGTLVKENFHTVILEIDGKYIKKRKKFLVENASSTMSEANKEE